MLTRSVADSKRPAFASSQHEEVEMRAEFSSFSYFRAVARALASLQSVGLQVEPLLPSDRTEVDRATGALAPESGLPLFLHVALPDYMVTSRARGWPAYEERFFRLGVSRSPPARRHNLLRCLALRYPDVYYVVAAMHGHQEFQRAVDSGQVLADSRFIPAGLTPMASDDRRQYLSFQRGVASVSWHDGEVRQLELDVTGETWLAHLRERVATGRPLGWRFLLSLRDALFSCLKEVIAQPALIDVVDIDPADMTPLTVLGQIDQLLLTQFEVEGFVVHAP